MVMPPGIMCEPAGPRMSSPPMFHNICSMKTAGERPSLQTTSKPGIASGRSHVPVVCSARRGQGASCEREGRVHTAQLTFGGWPCLSADSKRANMRSSADVTRVKSCEIDVALAKSSCRGCRSIADPKSALSRLRGTPRVVCCVVENDCCAAAARSTWRST